MRAVGLFPLGQSMLSLVKKCGQKVDFPGPSSRTPLHLAVLEDAPAVVALLVLL